MLDGVLEPLSLTTARVITDTARSRMVLACGGAVARDYVTLTAAALDAAIERLNRDAAPTSESRVSIQAEDVNVAARQRKNRKEEDELDQDAGADAVRLKDRWRDVCDFVREQGNIAFVLFRQKDLDEAPWGDEVRQLENLRLLHRIRDTVPNTPNWRGVKTVVYLVDLGQVAVQRLRTGIPSFWQGTSEFDKLRRAEWVYGPDWRTRLDEKRARQARSASQPGTNAPAAPPPEPVDSALTLFDDPADLDSGP
jgi:histone H3/H4